MSISLFSLKICQSRISHVSSSNEHENISIVTVQDSSTVLGRLLWISIEYLVTIFRRALLSCSYHKKSLKYGGGGGGGTPRNIWWGCVARFPKSLPYLWPTSDPVVQRVDNAIQRKSIGKPNYAIRWIALYTLWTTGGCNFSFPFYDQVKNSILHLWPLSLTQLP